MDYREYKVPEALQQLVQCVWQLKDAEPVHEAQVVYPDGRCELILHRGEPMQVLGEQGWQTQARCVFAGQLRTALRLRARGPLDCIGLRLRPAASAAVLSLPPIQFVDRIVDLRDIDARWAARLLDAASDHSRSPEQRVDLVLHELQQGLHDWVPDPRIEAAVVEIDAAQGELGVSALAQQVGMSMRALQTRFLAAVGLRPKEYARIQRLQATLRALDARQDSVSQLALEHGFSDQAHATRELRRLTGLTPARLRHALQAEREGDATLRMAAAFIRGRSLADFG